MKQALFTQGACLPIAQFVRVSQRETPGLVAPQAMEGY